MKKEVMTRAWEIAREAAAKFGGKASQYIGEALKEAWIIIKLKKIVNRETDDSESFRYNYSMKVWEKGGHCRTYLAMWRNRKEYGKGTSKKYDFGYIDHVKGTYVSGNKDVNAYFETLFA